MKGFKIGHADGRVVLVVDAAVVENQDVWVIAQHFPCGLEQLVANTDGGANGSVGVHEGDSAGVRPEVNRAGIALMAAYVNHLDGQSQHLSHDLGHRRGRPLPNIGSAGVDGHPAVHVDLDVNGGVWEILRVPVNREAGT